VIPFKYDSATLFEDGIALVRYKGQFGYVGKSGEQYWTEDADED
jgi:hypothetical protein